MRKRTVQRWLLLPLCLVLLVSCRKRPDDYGDADVVDFKLGNLLAEFTPPATLDELNAAAETTGGWNESLVADSLQLLRDRQRDEPVLCTVEEALALRNDSNENNEKIKNALGRLPGNESDADFEQDITRHSLQSVKNTNPLLGSSVAEFEVSTLTGIGLFNFDWNFRPFAAAEYVESWQSSADGLYEKVVIRDDIVWSDGQPVTAQDVEFSFQVIMTEQIPIPAVRSGTDKLKCVKAYDDRTVVFFHNEALETNVWNINFPLIPKHVYESTIPQDPTMTESDDHVAIDQKPVVGGPYEILSRTPTEVVLQRRDSYYMHEGQQVRDKPYFKKVRFRINPDASTALIGLKAGDVDTMELMAAQWTSQTNNDDYYEKNTKARAVEWVSFSFFWNTQSVFFEDVRVRQAMSCAFDHQELLSTLRYGRDEPCTGTFHPTSRWHPGPGNAVKNMPQPMQMDRDRAKQLLDDAGWTDTDGDGYRDKEIDGQQRKFEFTILVRNQKERIDICELLKQNLRSVGVMCNISTLESATLQDKMLNKKFDAAYGGWGTGADPDTSDNIWGTGQNRNYVSYSNPIIDEMFGEGRKLQRDRKPWKELLVWADEETKRYLGLEPTLADQVPQREDCYAVIQAVLWRDKPYTWLFYRNAYYAFSKRLRGYTFSPRGPYSFGPGFSSVWTPAH